MRFFFDNCLSPKLTEAMRLLNRGHHEIEHLSQRFSPDALDVDWLPQVAKDTELIVISSDPAIVSNKKEREIWLATGLTAFFFGGGFAEKGFWQQTHEVVRWWPDVMRTAQVDRERAIRGRGYLLPLGGKGDPKVLYPKEG